MPLNENSNSSLVTTKALRIALQEDQRCMSMKVLNIK
mgnify:CR=1 FL=1